MDDLTKEERDERRGRIGNFLLSSLRVSAGRYAAAADSFNRDLQIRREASFYDLDEEEQDFTLADRVVELVEATLTSEGWAACALMVASMSKQCPHRHFRAAWKCLEVWRKRCPAKEAPAMPAALTFGSVSWLALNGKKHAAGVVLVCFTGLLRVSEALALRSGDLILTSDLVTAQNAMQNERQKEFKLRRKAERKAR